VEAQRRALEALIAGAVGAALVHRRRRRGAEVELDELGCLSNNDECFLDQGADAVWPPAAGAWPPRVAPCGC